MAKQNYSPEYQKAAKTSAVLRRHETAKKRTKKKREERARVETKRSRGD